MEGTCLSSGACARPRRDWPGGTPSRPLARGHTTSHASVGSAPITQKLDHSVIPREASQVGVSIPPPNKLTVATSCLRSWRRYWGLELGHSRLRPLFLHGLCLDHVPQAACHHFICVSTAWPGRRCASLLLLLLLLPALTHLLMWACRHITQPGKGAFPTHTTFVAGLDIPSQRTGRPRRQCWRGVSWCWRWGEREVGGRASVRVPVLQR